ncbi:MAG: hypothetical protein EB138_05350 [Actinobacteria bacterium]|nr:hypothetical protein [Actinomycetota bacterium]
MRGAVNSVDVGDAVLTATLMALAAACLHAGWNLAVKRNVDSGLALWGQFFIAMLGALGALGVGEADHRRRIGGAAVVLVGLVALVAGG